MGINGFAGQKRRFVMEAEERQRRSRIVVSEYEGIQPHYVAFYIEAIVYAAERGTIASDRFTSLSSAGGPFYLFAQAALEACRIPIGKRAAAHAHPGQDRRCECPKIGGLRMTAHGASATLGGDRCP
ncbi:hypothetical protein [Brevundimonas sp. TWP2-3-4b1]|uniref:hypothetical protein n=1 Tax=Brevundimonas sp. TWP2-3-4b1 TaxID=2804580 RepID=UPI003CF83759